MSRYARKVDDNQAAIVKALRKAGCNVLSLAAVGNGCPDLLVCIPGVWEADVIVMLEIKDGEKSASRRKLTPHQKRFHEDWPVQVVTNEIEALRAVGL